MSFGDFFLMICVIVELSDWIKCYLGSIYVNLSIN